MNKLHLLSTAAAALLIAAGAASAQTMPERAPAAQRHAPAEKIAPPMHAGSHARGHVGAETTGAGGHEMNVNEHNKADMNAGEHGKAGVKSESETTGADANGSKSSKSEMNRSQSGGKEEMNKSSQTEPGVKTQEKTQENAQSKPDASAKTNESAQSKQSTTGQGAASGAAKLSTQQRTKITTIIKKQNVHSTHLNISVRVGARVPRSVHYYPLPAEVVDVYPDWHGYYFIMVGDQIVVIDPSDHEIVAILET